MGDIADSLIDGEFDYITGEYLGEGVGYPRTMHDRGRDLSNPIGGIMNFLAKKGYKVKGDRTKILYDYLASKGQPILNVSKFDACLYIRKDFNPFREYVKTLPKNPHHSA